RRRLVAGARGEDPRARGPEDADLAQPLRPRAVLGDLRQGSLRPREGAARPARRLQEPVRQIQPRRVTIGAMRVLVLLSLFAPPPAPADADTPADPYVYQRLLTTDAARVELETAVGTRDMRPFGERGIEETARGLFQLADRVELSVAGGVLFLGDETRG